MAGKKPAATTRKAREKKVYKDSAERFRILANGRAKAAIKAINGLATLAKNLRPLNEPKAKEIEKDGKKVTVMQISGYTFTKEQADKITSAITEAHNDMTKAYMRALAAPAAADGDKKAALPDVL